MHEKLLLFFKSQSIHFYFLAVDAFNEDVISQNVLKRLIKQDVIVEISLQELEDREKTYLFTRGIPTDYFVLILEGKVEVTVGNEDFTFDETQFSSFGAPALVSNPQSTTQTGLPAISQKGSAVYIPDYSVRVLTDVRYLKITRSMYRMAVKGTMVEREKGSGVVSEIFYPLKAEDDKTSLMNVESSL